MPGDERRQQILEAARRAFSRRGDVAGTTIRDIATEAGISEGNIYRHFDSKEELFVEAAVRPLQEAFERGEQQMRELMPDLPGADRHQLAVTYYRELVGMLADLTPLLGLVLFGDPKYADPFYRDVLRPALTELGQLWTEAYERITGYETTVTEDDLLAHFGVTLMFGLDQRRAADPPAIDAVAERLARAGFTPVAAARTDRGIGRAAT